MKNCSPSLVKNLEPLTDMVGNALTTARPASAQVKRVATIMELVYREAKRRNRNLDKVCGYGYGAGV